jgi:hypothetical protein
MRARRALGAASKYAVHRGERQSVLRVGEVRGVQSKLGKKLPGIHTEFREYARNRHEGACAKFASADRAADRRRCDAGARFRGTPTHGGATYPIGPEYQVYGPQDQSGESATEIMSVGQESRISFSEEKPKNENA